MWAGCICAMRARAESNTGRAPPRPADRCSRGPRTARRSRTSDGRRGARRRRAGPARARRRRTGPETRVGDDHVCVMTHARSYSARAGEAGTTMPRWGSASRTATVARLAAAAFSMIAVVAVLRAGQAAPPLRSSRRVRAAGNRPRDSRSRPSRCPSSGRRETVRVDVTVTGKAISPSPTSPPSTSRYPRTACRRKSSNCSSCGSAASVRRVTKRRSRSDRRAGGSRGRRDDVRVFALFLDDYHIDKAPQITIPMRQGLTLFINRLWPTDLVAIMDPLTPLSALRFTARSRSCWPSSQVRGPPGRGLPDQERDGRSPVDAGDIRASGPRSLLGPRR